MLLLDHGIVRADGRPDEVIGSYMNLLNSKIFGGEEFGAATGEPAIEVTAVELCGGDGVQNVRSQSRRLCG